MCAIIRTALLVLLADSLLAGCAATGAGGSRTAYEKACRSPMMKGAAAREAFWCWRSVGAKTYEEWIAYERAAERDAASVVASSAENRAR